MSTDSLKKAIEICGNVGNNVLKGETEGLQYKNALLDLLEVMKAITTDEIGAAGYPPNIENTLQMDKHLINGTVPEEADQLSLLNTVVTYISCREEGLPEHSSIYMDRVTELRKVIEAEYGTETMRFCGSDGC